MLTVCVCVCLLCVKEEESDPLQCRGSSSAEETALLLSEQTDTVLRYNNPPSTEYMFWLYMRKMVQSNFIKCSLIDSC